MNPTTNNDSEINLHEEEDEQDYIVEAIIDVAYPAVRIPHCLTCIFLSDSKKKMPIYLVRWSGYTAADDCWMDESDLQYGHSRVPLQTFSDAQTRNAREIVDTFWKSRMPQRASENQQAILELFSETHVAADLEALKVNPSAQLGGSDMDNLSTNLALRYASQSSVHQSFVIIPQGADNTLDWDDKQMVKAMDDIVSVVQEIPVITVQISCLQFPLRASQWECARAYYLTFYWFNGVGSQLALALVSKSQDLNGAPAGAMPLEQLSSHIIRYVRAIMRKQDAGLWKFRSILFLY